MALNNPSGLFGGYDVVFDSSPFLNYMSKMQARKATKENALRKYFDNAIAKATPTGMRGAEIPIFDAAVKQYQQFKDENMDALVGGGDPDLVAKANELARAPFIIAAESKAAQEATKQINSISQSNPDAFARWSDETLGKDSKTGQNLLDPNGFPIGLVAFSQPIYITDQNTGRIIKNPSYKPFDPTTIQVNPKKLTAKEMDDLVDKIGNDIDPDQFEMVVKPHPTFKTSKVQYSVGTFSPNALKKIEVQARNLYSDPAIKFNFEQNSPFKDFKQNNEDQFNQLNKVYQLANPGKNIEDDDDLFAAMAMFRKNIVKTSTPEDVPDWDKRNKIEYVQSLSKIAYSAKLAAKNNAAAASAAASIDNGNVFDAFPNYNDPNGKFRVIDGKAYDMNGAPYTGGGFIPKNAMPGTFFVALKGAKAGDPDFIKGVNVTVQDGRIVAAQNPYTGSIDRGAMKVMQDITDKEAKGASLKWGPIPISEGKKSKKDDLGF